jgi:hypothetical protein
VKPLATAPVLVLAASLAAASAPPRLRFEDNVFGRKYVNTYPRPYDGRTNLTTNTTLYFEVLVPDSNGPLGKVDPDTITAALVPSGGAPIPMLQAGQVFAAGFSGKLLHDIDVGADNGEAAYIVPAAPLDHGRGYRVDVYAETLDGVPIDPAADAWSFSTRAQIADPTVAWTVGLDGPVVRWQGWFFTGILKPNFDTSRLFDQLDSYVLMDAVHAANPDAWSLQRDWPLTSDYWHNGVFDGNPNPVRERETRRIVGVRNQGNRTLLTVADLEEGPLYGIPPGRPLGEDFHAGDRVTVADREKYEVAEVIAVDEQNGVVKVKQMLTPPSAWILDYPNSHPADNPRTPDNFTLPLCYLRKRDPVGTPVYYWTRIDDEWDIVHAGHGRRLQVNFSYTPLDLSLEPVPAHPGGHGSIGPPKDWLQWHEFVRQMVFHLIDRYGTATLDFYYSVGNENNFSIFWSGGKDGFYELYDYTVNAVLTAFEDRGLDAGAVQVGGIEAAGLGGRAWIRDALYHCSGTANKPGGDIAEQNFVCVNPLFDGRRAARVAAICAAHGGRGSPIDFVSIHEYEHSDLAVQDLTQVRDDALAMDPAYYGDLNVTCFECTPDWVPHPDPASAAIYLGNGFFPAWCADWMQRMVERAQTDARYARHESVLTVWPFDYNRDGISSITGLMRVDEDGDGDEDRISTIKKAIFNYIELLARMNRDLAALPAQTVAGIRLAGARSPAPAADLLMLYSHDGQDTESREETVFTARLSLNGIRWPRITVRRFRVDRDHSSPYRAYQALGEKSLYRPEELVDLEASDDLVQDGPAVDYETAGGSLTLLAPVAVNGVTFLEIRERDLDGDGVGDTADNCPDAGNPRQDDADADDRGDACDCAPLDAAAFALPREIANLRFLSGTTVLAWDSDAGNSGSGTVYDVARGDLAELPVGSGTSEFCLEPGSTDLTAEDAATPGPGSGHDYLVRGRNACGAGTYGADSAGEERSTSACP